MRVAVFDTHRYDRASFESANRTHRHGLTFFEARLNRQTATLATGFDVACSFVNDRLDRQTLELLKQAGVRLIALRSAGFNHVDLEAAAALGLPVVRVPEYSPYAVAEHAVALVLALDRGIHRAHARVREGNFSLDGLLGSDLHGKTVGLVGTGRIGGVAARIFRGFGCHVVAYDPEPRSELIAMGVEYVALDTLYARRNCRPLRQTLAERARALIAIAHPADRDDLARQWRSHERQSR